LRKLKQFQCFGKLHTVNMYEENEYVKGKVKVILEQAGKAQRGSRVKYSFTLSLSSGLDRWVINATLQTLYPRNRHDINFIEGWIGPRAGLKFCVKFHPPPPPIFDPLSLQPVPSPVASRVLTSRTQGSGWSLFDW
jgi:hypothetical protein